MDIQAIIDRAAFPVLVTDGASRIVALNAAAEALMDRRASDSRGKVCDELVGPGGSDCGRFLGTRLLADPPASFEIVFSTPLKTVLARVFVLAISEPPGAVRVVHLLQPLRIAAALLAPGSDPVS